MRALGSLGGAASNPAMRLDQASQVAANAARVQIAALLLLQPSQTRLQPRHTLARARRGAARHAPPNLAAASDNLQLHRRNALVGAVHTCRVLISARTCSARQRSQARTQAAKTSLVALGATARTTRGGDSAPTRASRAASTARTPTTVTTRAPIATTTTVVCAAAAAARHVAAATALAPRASSKGRHAAGLDLAGQHTLIDARVLASPAHAATLLAAATRCAARPAAHSRRGRAAFRGAGSDVVCLETGLYLRIRGS